MGQREWGGRVLCGWTWDWLGGVQELYCCDNFLCLLSFLLVSCVTTSLVCPFGLQQDFFFSTKHSLFPVSVGETYLVREWWLRDGRKEINGPLIICPVVNSVFIPILSSASLCGCVILYSFPVPYPRTLWTGLRDLYDLIRVEFISIPSYKKWNSGNQH